LKQAANKKHPERGGSKTHPFQGLAGPGRGKLTLKNRTDFCRLFRAPYILPVRPESPHRRMLSNDSSVLFKQAAAPEHRTNTLKQTANKKHPERAGS
jgi:hypothetical protein